MRKVAVYCGTRNVYRDMVPALKSLLAHTAVDKVYFLIEDDGFPEWLPSCVETVNVREQKIFPRPGPNTDRKWTWMVLMRAALSKILPQEELVLSLDNDTVVIRDIGALWELPIGDALFAAAREPVKSVPDRIYTNLGVALYNLRALRETGKDDQVIAALNSRPFPFAEQDALNALCQGGIYPMPCEYNDCEFTDWSPEPRIVHFAAERNWQASALVQMYREMRWSEILR